MQLSIEKLVYGGDGLSHADGSTVFVPYVLPGEEVRASIKTRRNKLIWGKLEEVTKPAPQRQEAPCPHFGTCGGCHYQHIPTPNQVEFKESILRETLSRLGRIRWDGPIQLHSAEPFGYRNRAQWAFRDAKPMALGYFLPESSVIVPIDVCPILSPTLHQTFEKLQNLARSGGLPEKMQEIEAFVDSKDEKIALNVAFERFPKPAAEIAAMFRNAVPQIESLLLLDQSKDRFELTGPGYLMHDAGGFRFRVSHLSFFQTNRFLVEDLLHTMTAGAKGELALDLYAGVGFFTLPLGKTFHKVISVDANLAATTDLYANAEAAGMAVTSHNEHAEEFLRKTQERPDFVSLDPPRAGLGAGAAAALLTLGAPEIRYLSCDPSTLARDLAVLTGSAKKLTGENSDASAIRYEIAEVHLFDLFPQTFHIETLVRLRRVP
ncbi:MAG TPA: 23S rRNA (uracil(1939)-C(5))-methyltransferase RlmD [Candidatus Sulfotelmatobacter sp.]|nr:23S rRNA (uracil(1939)-C(5))-methyltransferase RlmD [Candidatus Sulfotelmatobacter sp.]